MNLHTCPLCQEFSANNQPSFSPQRTRSRPYFNNGNRKYLTPANKANPKCTNPTSKYEESKVQ